MSVSALIIAMVTARPLLGQFDQAFQYIQEFTGFFTPGIVALFLLGPSIMETNHCQCWLISCSRVICVLHSLEALYQSYPLWIELVWCSLCVCGNVLVSLVESKHYHKDAVELSDVTFKTSNGFNAAGVAVAMILVAILLQCS